MLNCPLRLLRFAFSTLAVAVLALAAGVSAPRIANAWWNGGQYSGCTGTYGNYQYLCDTPQEACEGIRDYHAGLYDFGPLTPIKNNLGKITGYSCYIIDQYDNAVPFWIPIVCASDEYKDGTVASGCRKTSPTENQKNNGRACKVNAAGNPITIGTGNKFEEVTDYRSAGPNVLHFTRYYNSHLTTIFSMGRNWRHNFDRRLIKDGATWRLLRPDGTEIHFRYYGYLGGLYWYVRRVDYKDVYVQMIRRPSTNEYEFYAPDGSKEYYHGTTYRLLKIRYPNTYELTFTYNGSGQLTTVTDSHSRSLTLTYNSDGLLETMTDPDGRVYKYEYKSVFAATFELPADLLEKVRYPDTTSGTWTDNPTVTYHYENANFPSSLTGITDEKGVRVSTWTYDSEGRGASSEKAGGVLKWTITHNANGTKTVTNPLGKQAIYTFTQVKHRYLPTQVDGQASTNCVAASRSATYDAYGKMTSRTDWKGNVTNFTLDQTTSSNTRFTGASLETQRKVAVGTAQERTITTSWYDNNWLPVYHKPTQIVKPGRTLAFTYDSSLGWMLLKTVTITDTTSHTVPYSTNGQARTWTFNYNADGLVSSVDGPLSGTGDTTSYEYTTAGYLKKITDPLGHVTEITSHTASGLPLTLVDRNGIQTTFVYDTRGRITSYTVNHTSGNATTSFVYDDVGNVTKVTLPDASYLDYTYDNARRLTEIANSLGEKIVFTYNNLGQVTKQDVKAAGGAIVRTQTRVYDELGRLMKVIGSASQTWTVGYDKNSNPTTLTNPLGKTTTYAYDSLNRLISMTNALSATASATYNDRDDATGVTDQRTLTTSFVYNGFGEVIQRTSPDTGTTVYQRDAAGRITQRTDAKAVVTNYTYDNAHRLLTVSYPANSSLNITYTYDDTTGGNFGKGRLTGLTDSVGTLSFKYDHRGNLIERSRVIGAVTYTTKYAYDLADNLTEITYPSGRIVTYTRDTLGRVTTVTTKANALATPVTIASSIAWKPFGPLASLNYGNGLTLTLTWDTDYRLTALNTSAGGTVIQNLSYTYNAVGNVTGVTDNADSTRTQTFTYDDLQRLLTAAGAYGTTSYAYDAVGNRTQKISTPVGGTATTETYTYATTSNRLNTVGDGTITRTFSYDANGSVTTDNRGTGTTYTLVYGEHGRMTQLKQGTTVLASYTYDAADRRAIRVAGATTTHYQFGHVAGGGGKLLAESDATGAVQREYVWLGSMPLARIDTTGSGGGATIAVYYTHPNHLGASHKITDGAKLVVWDGKFTPFGKAHAIAGSLSHDRRFPGQYHDSAAGYVQNHRRDYDPSIGRYLQSDPIGLSGGLNTYAYVNNNPQNLIDPRGEQAVRYPDGRVCTMSMAGIHCSPPRRGGENSCRARAKWSKWWKHGDKIFQFPGYKAEHTKGKRPSTRPKSDDSSNGEGTSDGNDDGASDESGDEEKYNPKKYGRTPKKTREEILKENPKCEYCGKPADTIDHKESKKKHWDRIGKKQTKEARTKDVDRPENTTGACKSCNSSKQDKKIGRGPGEWTPPNWK